MKRMIPFLLLLLLTSILFPKAHALDTEAGLTRGVEILYEKDKLEKAALPGQCIRFTHLDFLQKRGEAQMDGIVIRSLPPANEGVLTLGTERIRPGAFIPSDMIEKLQFDPADDSVSCASFRYAFEDGGAAQTVSLRFADKAPEQIQVQNQSVETYRNVARTISFDTKGAGRIRILQSPRKGALLIDGKTGTARYTPGRNITGSDQFRYCLVNEAGEQSKEATVSLKIDRSPGDLFFTDCVGASWHYAAVWACEKGLLSYETGTDGLPAFCPEKQMNDEEREAMRIYLFPGVLSVLQTEEKMTRGEGAALIESALKGQEQRSRKMAAFKRFFSSISFSESFVPTPPAYLRQSTVSGGRSRKPGEAPNGIVFSGMPQRIASSPRHAPKIS